MPEKATTAARHAVRLAEFAARPLLPGDAYYTLEGYTVFTAQYHQRRGYCCGSGCRHCPWKVIDGALSK